MTILDFLLKFLKKKLNLKNVSCYYSYTLKIYIFVLLDDEKLPLLYYLKRTEAYNKILIVAAQSISSFQWLVNFKINTLYINAFLNPS